jgi:Bacteriophage replication gene A protein (GPA)
VTKRTASLALDMWVNGETVWVPEAWAGVALRNASGLNLDGLLTQLPQRWHRRLWDAAMMAGRKAARTSAAQIPHYDQQHFESEAMARYRLWSVNAARKVVAEFMARHLPPTMQVSPAAADAEIVEKARTIAEHCSRVLGTNYQYWDGACFAVKECARRGVAHPVAPHIHGLCERVKCEYWWRRALRREQARAVERSNIELRYVHAKSDAYVSDDAVRRRTAQNARNARALAGTFIQSQESGAVITLQEAADASVSNKAIRRGELMLRLRGMEACADKAGLQGFMFTLTCPSRFHSSKKIGERKVSANKSFDGSTPRDAQAYLCRVWARIRAKLAREGVTVFGMRVAEPHHDGCPHWHGLLFTDKPLVAAIVMRHYALQESGDEAGAMEHRTQFTLINKAKGSAAGYIAKYISKNIDGVGVGVTRTRDGFVLWEQQEDLFSDRKITPSQRVEAWAATWGIRQFQQIGGAPVGVWRELRRIEAKELPDLEGDNLLLAAWAAAQKIGDEEGVSRAADWAEYSYAQGGIAGEARRLSLYKTVTAATTRYGEAVLEKVRGVAAMGAYRVVDGICNFLRYAKVVAVSARQSWLRLRRSAKGASTRTRDNNCTVDMVSWAEAMTNRRWCLTVDYG